ncbi:MAG: phenylalanine--tRNA ligase subunit beta [bacterium]|nr:phenylalanine--tRNA ligase subunit beta [bacterium]
MKITYNWIKEFVDIPWDARELAEQLTLSGSEVEDIYPAPSLFDNIKIGQVVSVNKHPNADKLTVCEVDLGDFKEALICGAPNVAEGQKVVVALVGAVLPNGMTIKKAKIRGVESSGMICSEAELGISEEAGGIMVLSPDSITGNDYIPEMIKEDTVLDVFINPNRPDCMSIYGLAREAAALSGNKILDVHVEINNANDNNSNEIEIVIEDRGKCPRYSAALIKDVKVKPSPLLIQHRLNAVGLRPINNIVDATNYCLMEWGHPLHAFDLKEIRGNRIVVKTAEDKEKFVTLDGEKRELNSEVLLICDGDRPIALGGIMGGENSEVTEKTTDLLIECAYFDPLNILRSSKHLGLGTDASRRFERGMDPNFCIEALDRISGMISRLTGGKVYKPYFDEYPEKKTGNEIRLRPERLSKVAGKDFSNDEITDTLGSLGVKTEIKDNLIIAQTPTFRPDLKKEIDLIEEIPRVIGLDKIEPKMTAVIPLRDVGLPEDRAAYKLRDMLSTLGFNETYTYSMIDSKFKESFDGRGKPIFLKNPISPELSLMRQSLLPGLLSSARHNINRDLKDLRIYEIGKVFGEGIKGKDDEKEALYLSGLISGNSVLSSWDHREYPNDVFTLKGILQDLFQKISLDKIEFISYDYFYLEDSCAVKIDGAIIGSFGRYKDKSLVFELETPIYLFEFEAAPLLAAMNYEKVFKEFSKYPPAKRDLAFVIPDSIPVQEVIDHIKTAAGSLLSSIEVDDVYRGKQLPEDCRSVKLSLKFYSLERSLLDNEVEKIIEDIIGSSKTKFNIDIRS